MKEISKNIWIDNKGRRYETEGKVVKKIEGIGRWIFTGDCNHYPRMMKLKSFK